MYFIYLLNIDVIKLPVYIVVHAETPEEEEELKEEVEEGLHYAALSIISLFVVEVIENISCLYSVVFLSKRSSPNWWFGLSIHLHKYFHVYF